MGPSRAKWTQEEAAALLREKDDQIANLETKLEAYSARASTAQTRLLKTIDVLDALRTQHALELSTEEQAKLKLAHEADRWRSIAKALEVEKDELKDVVEDLIEKVQISNEWSSWPCSRMHISKHAEQVSGGTFDLGRTNAYYNDDLLAYATSIIARLRTELDFERQSHSRVIEEANLRIEELEAKVAVREAELESCIISHDSEDHGHRKEELDDLEKYNYAKRRMGRKIPQPKAISDEECLRFLESNNARNRSLEIEIRNIAERLEQTRMAASTASELGVGASSPASRNDQNGAATPISRARSASVDPNVLSRSSEHIQPEDEILSVSSSPSTTLSIAQLDNQIRAMTAQMDALRIERKTLVETAARQRRATNGIDIDNFQDVLRVEGECVRLQAEVDDLREQLDLSRSSARSREKAFLREIAHLRASIPGTLRPTHDLFSPKLIEEEIIPEESMDLATPLQPTISAPTPASVPTVPTVTLQSQHPADPDLSSIQFAPERMSSPPPDARPTPPNPRSNSGKQDIDRVQAALDDARAHLIEKEAELALLRAEMKRVGVGVGMDVSMGVGTEVSMEVGMNEQGMSEDEDADGDRDRDRDRDEG